MSGLLAKAAAAMQAAADVTHAAMVEFVLFGQSMGQIAQGLQPLAARRLRPPYAARRRSRGPQAPSKRRSNRVHVSRRTRRKHRRAA